MTDSPIRLPWLPAILLVSPVRLLLRPTSKISNQPNRPTLARIEGLVGESMLYIHIL